MRVEAPQFKRCLCCLPLRYGLLATGYLKLLVGALTIISWIVELLGHEVRRYWPGWFIAIKCFAVLVVVGDTALSVVFVIGCHKKDARLLRIYNNYSIGFCILYILLWLGVFLYWFVLLAGWAGVLFATYALRFIIILGVLNFCLQVYLILLTRSEILKLENNTQFSFSNNANEAECAMVNETGNYVKNTENLDNNLTQSTLLNNNDNDEKEDPEISVNDEVKSQNKLFNKLNGNYAKL